MMSQIYGNENTLHLMQVMVQNEKVPHACLIHGAAGMGKKTLAKYFAQTILCTGAVKPCGECPSCRKVLHDAHPDILWVEHSGKRQGFSVETVRTVCRESIVAPNDGERKIYIFADCDNMDIRAQNTLLKLTEEPPAHVLLLFTAADPQVFLETMRSRMMQMAACPCTEEDCRNAILAQGHTPEQAEQAAAICGGNIGRGLAWLDSEEMQTMTRQIGALTEAIAAKQFYEVLRILADYEKDAAQAAELIRLLDLQLRDALILKFTQAHLTGCDRRSAQTLSNGITLHRSEQMHRAVQEAHEALRANVSTKLVLATLGGELCG